MNMDEKPLSRMLCCHEFILEREDAGSLDSSGLMPEDDKLSDWLIFRPSLLTESILPHRIHHSRILLRAQVHLLKT